MDNEYTEVNYFGLLITNYGEEFYLMMNRPVDKEMWMNDNIQMFLGAVKDGKVQQIIVQGFTLLPDARGKVRIRKDKEAEESVSVEWLEEVLADEPLSLVE